MARARQKAATRMKNTLDGGSAAEVRVRQADGEDAYRHRHGAEYEQQVDAG